MEDYGLMGLAYSKQKISEGIGDFKGIAMVTSHSDKNTLLLTRYDLSETDMYNIDVVVDILSSFNDTAREYLHRVLGENNGITIVLSKVDGTTSDFAIYYDVDLSGEYNMSKAFGKITEIDKNGQGDTSYKYVECRDGMFTKISF